MNNSLKIKEMYNKRARVYDILLGKTRYHYSVRAILESIKLEICSNPNILEIGCGTGLASEILIKRFPEAKITCVDYSESMLYLYKTRFPKTRIIVGDFNKGDNFHEFESEKKAQLDANSFDLIVSTGAVSEYGDKDKVIPFIYKLLKKESIFINIGIRKNVMGLVTGRLWRYKPIGKRELIRICRIVGFSKINTARLSWNHFPSNITKFVLKAVK